MVRVQYLHFIIFLILILNVFFKIFNDNAIRRLFTLTLQGRIKRWFEMFPTKSIHMWEQFMELFLSAREDYNYNVVCLELENLCKFEGDPTHEFFSRFMLTFFKFCEDDQPSGEEALYWFLYINSLSNKHDQQNNDGLENDLSHDMHVNKDIILPINVDSMSTSIKSTNNIEIVMQRQMLGFYNIQFQE
jgi:hypothetical protein